MVNSINLVNSIEQVQKAKSGVKAWEEEIMNRAGALIPALSKSQKMLPISMEKEFESVDILLTVVRKH